MKVLERLKSSLHHQPKDESLNDNFDLIMVDVESIKKGTPFIQLFPIKPDVLASITQDMEVNGYDISQPIIIWEETNLLIDGHTRTKAAEQANIKQVSAIYYSFEDVDSALRYAYGLQFKRRNIDDSDRFSFAEQYLNNLVQGNKKSGWKKKELAEILSVSMTTAQKYLSVINRATDKIKEAVKIGDISINTAYKRLLQSEGGKKKSNNPVNESKPQSDKSETLWNSCSIDSIRIKGKVDLWNENPDYRDRIVAISELLPKESKIAQYVDELLGKDKDNVSL